MPEQLRPDREGMSIVSEQSDALRSAMNEPLLQRITRAIGIAVMGLAVFVMTAWYSNHPSLVRLGTVGRVMRFNTAVMFTCLGIAFVAISIRRFKLARVAGAFTLVLGSLTLTQYPLQINLGVDELFFKNFYTLAPMAVEQQDADRLQQAAHRLKG